MERAPMLKLLRAVSVARRSAEILIYGPSAETERFLRVFPVGASSAVAIANASTLPMIDLSGIEAAIVLEPLRHWMATIEANFGPTIQMLQAHGIDRNRMMFPHQPGRIFRAVRPFLPGDFNTAAAAHAAIFHDVFTRPNYGYGMMLAAEIGRRMDRKDVTIVETGVWTGSGLENLCEFADFLHQTQDMNFRIFGFDTGKGLPAPKDWRDHPELWPEGSMVMPDHEALRARLPKNCELILGDVADTIPGFVENTLSPEAPLAFLSLDVDLYTASVEVLRIFDGDAEKLSPAVPIWVDDSNINVLQTRFAGEALAIEHFNHRSELRKIDFKIVRTNHQQRLWHHCFAFAHIFDHPVRTGARPAKFDGFFHVAY